MLWRLCNKMFFLVGVTVKEIDHTNTKKTNKSRNQMTLPNCS
ncbi:hypothetical protein MTBBW1_1410007 [Desulfamplus magnetovallimortis]|uniref:Uncharacterized protein n=1 Tax=Desulfamplus magnetovallimortis TaxID=1246637 RepID=A0A1W1H7X8_9BACT|nr:hypothetical protein MTBBW1_1410007 [Desulfamplus magnetovallimortis]